MIISLNYSLFVCLCVLLGVAFYTLLERKILGLLQIRKGPNKVGMSGIVQPLSDALKLLIKEIIYPLQANKILFSVVPMLGLVLSLFFWILLPGLNSLKLMYGGVLLFLCLSSLNVFITLLSGWSSNSKYAFLGALRAVAQSVSYEISLVLIILFPTVLLCSLMWTQPFLAPFPTIICSVLVGYMWFTSCLAETNRAPFDFAEGESELVSGFNIEFSGGLFVLLFLAEYSNMLFLSHLTALWFLSLLLSNFYFLLMSFSMAVLFLLIRGVYPRYRYDLLMMLCWKSFLPVILLILIMEYGLKLMFL